MKNLPIIGVALALLTASGCGLRVGGKLGAPEALQAGRHNRTEWTLQPSYPHDALAFLNLISLDPYFLSFYDAAIVTTWRERLEPRERKAVDRLHSTISRRFNISLSSLLAYFYDATGSCSLAEFRESLRDPDTLLERHRYDLDQLSARLLGGWRIPKPTLNSLCRDLGSYLDFLERSDFEDYWRQTHEPELARLAANYSAELAGCNMVGAVEEVLGGGLPGPEVTVLLGAFLRPNGISLGRNRFLMEDRIDRATLLAVAAHELIHGYADWTAPGLRQLPELLSRDRLAARRFKERNRSFNYNSWPVIAEEAWTKVLDQLVQERLSATEAPDPRERWFFHDDGLHAASLALYRLIQEQSGTGGSLPWREQSAAEWLAGQLQTGSIGEQAVSRRWEQELGYHRPGSLPEAPRIRRVFAAGDPALDSLNPVYNEVLKAGQFVVFLDDWFVFDGPARDSLRVLNELGLLWQDKPLADPLTGLVLNGRFLFAGNVSTQRDSKTVYYRNALYFRRSD